MMTNLNFTDMETGYKAFRVDILKQIKIEQRRFGFEPEITAKVTRMKCRIYEIGISYTVEPTKMAKNNMERWYCSNILHI